MKYTKTNTKKSYTSPELSIHELRFEGALLDVSTEVPDLDWDDAPRFKSIQIDDEDGLVDCQNAEFYDGGLMY